VCCSILLISEEFELHCISIIDEVNCGEPKVIVDWDELMDCESDEDKEVAAGEII